MRKRYNRIKVILAEKNKSSKWLADELDKDKSTISRWCTNDMQPSIITLFKIADLLEVDVRNLIISTERK